MAYALGQFPMVVYGIYDISKPDICEYVGMTTKGIKSRAAGHWSGSRALPLRKLPIILWMSKRQKSDLEFRQLEVADDLEHLKFLERFWIAQMRDAGQARLNLTDGGEALNGSKWSDERRAAHSEKMRGDGNPSWGKDRSEVMAYAKSFQSGVVSAETRAKMSASRTGRRATPETLAKMSKAQKAAKNTPEYKAAASERMSGSGNPRYGKVISAEQKKKISNSSPRTVLNEDIVREIRKRAGEGERKKDIAILFGVDPSTISGIVARRRWSWVD